jgi:hypothetical protein
MLSRFSEWRRYRRMMRESRGANRKGDGVDPSDVQQRLRGYRGRAAQGDESKRDEALSGGGRQGLRGADGVDRDGGF